MGNILKSTTQSNGQNLKRKMELDESDCSSGVREIKRRKPGSTSKYIYNALFINGENSDITIRAADREWKLHKLYLRQAGYFSGMFQGAWKETDMTVIDLHIPDDNITENSLNSAFGSLYSDDLTISPNLVISVLAAASLIQLEGLMDQCSQVMIESISVENVCEYYHASRVYGQTKVEESCINWLENNLMIKFLDNNLISAIDPELMTRLVSSQELFILQVEMDVYTLLRRWLFLRLNDPGHQVGDKSTISLFFREKYRESGKAFVLTYDGKKYMETFQSVRFCNILRDFACCVEVEGDGIVPCAWLLPLYRDRWLTMLRVEQGVDRGPSDNPDMDGEGLRCGRMLQRDVDHCWRWNGYNFSLDLLITYNSKKPRSLLLKRNIKSQRRVAAVGLVSQRKVIYKIKVFSLDEKGHVTSYHATGPKLLALEKDEECVVLMCDTDKQKFPMFVSATFRVVSPKEMLPNFEIHPIAS